MQTQPNISPAGQGPVISVINDTLTSSRNSADHKATLQRLAAHLTYLADAAQIQEKFELEAMITRTAAEILTSSREISTSTYAAAFIARLTNTVRKIERNLGDMSSYQLSAHPI